MACLAACTLWHIWIAICERVFENKMHHPNSIIHIIRHCIHSFSNSNLSVKSRDCIVPNHWKKPPVNWLKLNIDASVKDKNSNAGFSLIFRDHTGKFLGAMAYSAVARDIHQAENLVRLQALRWIKDLGFKQVIIEGDNQAVINCCKGTVKGIKWEDQNILLECRSLFHSLELCEVSFQTRLCNHVADKLAKFARSSVHFQIWWDDPPNIISQALEQDSYMGIPGLMPNMLKTLHAQKPKPTPTEK
ncbi:uncharacterized protein LOC113334329 [Papaver somniferum]|uniref:uncharacterized protein LOC113334066 n=1 Tax=Papaver somniferum TaxID=3469 RepID=UPI000E6F9D44|nr:uncharacterized protein LOC113334066 [Papaver somniferum]XP_026436397.1 uncharacterized protein LOC113334329 [Papaver somniferum]